MKPRLNLHTSQHMAMTPQLLQSIRMLQLSSLELEQEIRQALDTNVMLEAEEEGESETESEVVVTVSEPVAEAAPEQEAVSGCDADAHSKVEADFDWSSAESWSGGEPRDDEEGESWINRQAAPAPVDARVAAIEQLRLTISDAREARIASVILEAIDDNGYLEQPLDGIVLELGTEFAATQAEVEAVLEKVQAVEPTGFGARSLQECLLLQLRMLPKSTEGLSLAQTIVSTCLERLASNDWSGVDENLQVSADEIRQAMNIVLSLNPKPAATLAAAAAAVVPDVVVTGTAGNWKVELNPSLLPKLRVNSMYERMLTQSTPHRALRDQLQEARWLVRGLEMRHMTLLRTARAIFERQSAFLEKGEVAMVPLTLREIAAAISMHESTVCRVTSQKWVQTPWGVYELKAFFPSQITGSVNEVSGTAVKAMIRRIVDTESAAAPLCDGDIAAILARNGIRVARRTVAKYREAMRIGSAKERGVTVRPGMRMAG